jgi:hypothetical protein
MMKTSTLCSGALLLVVGVSGCIVEDNGGSRGQANAPAASVPDSGSPGRRESPSKTLKDAREPEAPSDGSLDVKTSEPQ